MKKQSANTITFFILLAVLGILFLFTIRYFFEPLLFAILIAAFSYPIYQKIVKRLKGQQYIAAIICVILLTIFIVIPLGLISMLLIRDSLVLFDETQNVIKPVFNFLEKQTNAWHLLIPESIKGNMSSIEWQDSLVNFLQNIANFIISQIHGLTSNFIHFIGKLLIMFFALFYMYVDGPRWAKTVMKRSPLSDRDEKNFFNKFIETAKATLLGTIVIGATQGFLGGLAFWLVGIRAPVFWGLIMMILSIIPGVGTAIIWVPAAIILIIKGKVLFGLGLIGFGILLICTVDDFLRSFLVGKQSNIHPLFILISTLGGLIAFGFSGFILGPIIVALFFSFLEIYEKRYLK